MDFLCVLQLKPHYKIKSNWTEATNKVLGEHWNYLVDLHSKGKIKFVARTDYDIEHDANRGLAVYAAATKEEALEMMMSDPSISNNIMQGELHPLTVFMLGSELQAH